MHSQLSSVTLQAPSQGVRSKRAATSLHHGGTPPRLHDAWQSRQSTGAIKTPAARSSSIGDVHACDAPRGPPRSRILSRSDALVPLTTPSLCREVRLIWLPVRQREAVRLPANAATLLAGPHAEGGMSRCENPTTVQEPAFKSSSTPRDHGGPADAVEEPKTPVTTTCHASGGGGQHLAARCPLLLNSLLRAPHQAPGKVRMSPVARVCSRSSLPPLFPARAPIARALCGLLKLYRSRWGDAARSPTLAPGSEDGLFFLW